MLLLTLTQLHASTSVETRLSLYQDDVDMTTQAAVPHHHRQQSARLSDCVADRSTPLTGDGARLTLNDR